MLKRLINGEIALGFLIATLFWIAVLGWATSYAPTEPEKEACYQTAKQAGSQTEECKTFWERTTSDPVAMFTLVLAFSTVGLWVATLALYIAGKSHSERELRAYIVGATSAKFQRFTTPSPVTILTFKNSGKTPAYNVRVWTSSAVAIYPMENRPREPEGDPGEQSSVGIVGPGAEFHNEISSDIEVTAEERAEVIAGRCAFYIYGRILYRDTFGFDRTASFCHFLAGDRARGDSGPLATYYKWNEAN